jgi:hypothetical protein
MTPLYLNDWKETGEAGMLADFGIDKALIEGAEIIVASYTYEDYSGSAFVLFRRDGKLWEVNGSHCSCHGLSESNYSGDPPTQWQPEETSAEALKKRVDSGYFLPDEAAAIVAAISPPPSAPASSR